mgnify:CR=1 FL=1
MSVLEGAHKFEALVVGTSNRTPDFERHQPDVAVRWGARWPGLECL